VWSIANAPRRARQLRTPSTRIPLQAPGALGALLEAQDLFMPQTGPGESLGDLPLTYRLPCTAVFSEPQRDEDVEDIITLKFILILCSYNQLLKISDQHKKSKAKDADSTTYQL